MKWNKHIKASASQSHSNGDCNEVELIVVEDRMVVTEVQDRKNSKKLINR